MQNQIVGSVKNIECQVGEVMNGGDCKIPTLNLVKSEDSPSSTIKMKRKARSTRRRLNAMMSNASLHFSDTDSEGELQVPRASTPTKPSAASKFNSTAPLYTDGQLLHPTISVTLDGSGDDSSCASGDRRNSFMDNLTDVDEIYTSEPENNNDQAKRPRSASLAVADNSPQQGETDCEEMSNDENEEVPIYVEPRGDILVDFTGETITTKEGDGPFSVEIRNQMSVDLCDRKLDSRSRSVVNAPEIEVVPTTDSEDMEASDDDEELEGACGLRENIVDDLEILAASQIVMKNVNKMDQLLSVREPEDGLSDAGHTDVEDLE